MRWKGGFLAAFGCGCFSLIIGITGYGSYLPALWPLAIAALSFLGLLHPLGLKLPPLRKFVYGISLLVLLNAAFVTGWGAGILWRDVQCRKICPRCEPILNALEAYRSMHGEYPASLGLIPEAEELNAAGIKVIEGRFSAEGLEGDTDDADVVVYLDRERYFCEVRIEKKPLLSFMRYHSYLRRNGDSRWSRISLYWSLYAR